jgi:hypothetical protein
MTETLEFENANCDRKIGSIEGLTGTKCDVEVVEVVEGKQKS